MSKKLSEKTSKLKLYEVLTVKCYDRESEVYIGTELLIRAVDGKKVARVGCLSSAEIGSLTKIGVEKC